MIHRKHIQNGLTSLLIMGACALAFFLLFEKDQMERITPASREARKNPFLAAERFLAESGLSVTSTSERDILLTPPPPSHMIFVNRLGGNLPREREDNLIAWMEHGGTLVITPHKAWDEARGKSGNTLLDRLGVLYRSAADLKQSEDDGAPETDEETDPDGLTGSDDPAEPEEDMEEHPFVMDPQGLLENNLDTETVTVSFDDGTSAVIECIADRVLENGDGQPLAVHSGDSGPHILSKAVGQGRLIVLSDNHWLRNDRIGLNDHAYVWGEIAAGHGKTWILYTSLMPSFFMTILGKAPFVVVSLLILCLMFLFWLTRSIGPRYRVPDYASRNISEHLLAAGLFTLRQGSGQSLIQGTRSLIGKRLKTRHLFFAHKTRDEQVAYLAQWTGLSEDEIRAAFNGPVEKKEAFIAASASLQKINRDVLVNSHRTEKT